MHTLRNRIKTTLKQPKSRRNATNRGGRESRNGEQADGMHGMLTGGGRGSGGGGGGRERGGAGWILLLGLSRAAAAPFLAAAVLPAAWAAELLAAAARSSTSVPAARSSDGSSSCASVAVEAVPAEFLAVPSSWSAAAVPSSPAPSCSTAAAALALPSAASSCTSGTPMADDGAASDSALSSMSSFSSFSPSPRPAVSPTPQRARASLRISAAATHRRRRLPPASRNSATRRTILARASLPGGAGGGTGGRARVARWRRLERRPRAMSGGLVGSFSATILGLGRVGGRREGRRGAFGYTGGGGRKYLKASRRLGEPAFHPSLSPPLTDKWAIHLSLYSRP